MKPKKTQKQWYWEATAVCYDKDFDLISGILFDENVTGIEEIENENRKTVIRIYFSEQSKNPNRIITTIDKQLKENGGFLKLESLEKKGEKAGILLQTGHNTVQHPV